MAAGDRESENEKRKEKAFERILADALAFDARKNCPDAEILAAFYERWLDARDMERWRAHFADCSRCQQALAAMAAADPNPLAEAEIARLGELVAAAAAPAHAAAKPRVPRASRWAWFFDPRSLAPLAAAVIFGVASWMAVRSPYGAPVENLVATAPAGPASMIAENRATPAPPTSEVSPNPREGYALQAPERRATREMPAAAPAPPPPPPPTPAAAQQAESGAAARKAPGSATESVTVTTEAPLPMAGPSEGASGSAAGATGGAEKEGYGGAREPGARPAAAASEAPNATSETIVAVMPSARVARAQAKAGVVGMMAAKTNAEIEWRFGGGGRIERSSDGGRTWVQQVSPVKTELLAGSAPSETVCWIVGRGGAIVRTTDGVNWESVVSPAEAEENGQPPDWTFVEARDALYVVIHTENGRRFYTSDGGKTWQAQ